MSTHCLVAFLNYVKVICNYISLDPFILFTLKISSTIGYISFIILIIIAGGVILLILKKNTQLKSTLNKEYSVNLYDYTDPSIISDLQDNFGNRLAAIFSISKTLKQLKSDDNIDTDLFDKFLNQLDISICLLGSELKILKWASNPENNYLDNVIGYLSNYNGYIQNQGRHLKIISRIAVKNVKLPKYWNRQILLLINEVINNTAAFYDCRHMVLTIEYNKYNKLSMLFLNTDKNQDVTNINSHNISQVIKKANIIKAKTSLYYKKDKNLCLHISCNIPSYNAFRLN